MNVLRTRLLLSVVLGLVVASAAVSPVAAEPSSSASSSAASSTSPSAALRQPSRRSLAPAIDDSLTTAITSAPARFSTDRSPTFTYQAPDRSGVRFRCALQLGAATPTEQDCVAGLTTSGGVATATMQYADLARSKEAYQFSVLAYVPAGGGTAEVDGPVASYDWHLYALFAPDSYRPGTGATFNNPLGDRAARRRNLRHAIRAIDSMPGYEQPATGSAPCPSTASAAPSRIRIAVFAMTDGPFADSLVAASRRCVSVQLLMHNLLTRSDDPAFRRLQDAVGSNRGARSFAWRCHFGCRGSGVLHTKMYLFDTQQAGATAAIQATVMFGSSNMTENAVRHQWNDLYTVAGHPRLYGDYAGYFDLMKLDNGFHRNPGRYGAAAGYPTVFWPVGANQSDPEKDVLRSLRCAHATGGTGVNGHTAVYINMHAWHGLRGLDFVRLARGLYARGCYVRVLYGFMPHRVYHRLTVGTGSRMSVRRTAFSRDGVYASVYSHFKAIIVTGHIGTDTSARAVWTGSNNFTSGGTHHDEMMVRIHGAVAYHEYRDWFHVITVRKSSPVWARFRAPPPA
jgi:hypothetical protein